MSGDTRNLGDPPDWIVTGLSWFCALAALFVLLCLGMLLFGPGGEPITICLAGCR